MKFISKVSINIKSGKGGDGIISWRRESRVRFGGPSGGNGGNGGNVYIVADINLNTLFHIRSNKYYCAKNGENGMSKCMHGANGEDLHIYVPCGTNVYDAKKSIKLAELINDKEEFLVCSGGKGGKGNLFFKSSNRPTPYMYDRGDPCEEKDIILELESVADIGFLGFPNSGKSTLLSQISNAKPKIANFPFTTLIPVLGKVEHKGKHLIFADIPGLIEGASEGHGLGFEFLKHLNRCKVLIHLVEASLDNTLIQIEQIEKEIKVYSEILFNKPRLLVVNKIDLLTKEELDELKVKLSKHITQKEIIYISALDKINIDYLLDKAFEIYEEFADEPKEDVDYLEFVDDEHKHDELKIEKIGDTWHVDSHVLRYWHYKIPQTTVENIQRLRNKFESNGVDKELLKLGAKLNDKVCIAGMIFNL